MISGLVYQGKIIGDTCVIHPSNPKIQLSLHMSKFSTFYAWKSPIGIVMPVKKYPVNADAAATDSERSLEARHRMLALLKRKSIKRSKNIPQF